MHALCLRQRDRFEIIIFAFENSFQENFQIRVNVKYNV